MKTGYLNKNGPNAVKLESQQLNITKRIRMVNNKFHKKPATIRCEIFHRAPMGKSDNRKTERYIEQKNDETKSSVALIMPLRETNVSTPSIAWGLYNGQRLVSGLQYGVPVILIPKAP